MARYNMKIANGPFVSSDELLAQLAAIDTDEARRARTALAGICAYGIAYTNQDFDLMSNARRIIERHRPTPAQVNDYFANVPDAIPGVD